MITRVKIEPIDRMSVSMLIAAYDWKGKYRMLTEDDSIIEFPQFINKDNPRPPERIINFGKNYPFIEYAYDVGLSSPYDKKIEMAILDFWANHPQLTVNGKTHYADKEKKVPTTKAPAFNMVNHTDTTSNEIRIWKDVLAVANKINETGYEDKKNMCYYYGINPQGKTEIELTLLLGNFTDGVCVKESELENFKKIFVNDNPSDKDLIVNCRKAISYGIIQEKTNEGRSSYYLGETFIGVSFNDILAFVKRDEKIYQDHILNQILQKEGGEKKEVKIKEVKSAEPSEERTALIEEVKKLKAEGHIWKGLNPEKTELNILKNLVEEGKKKLAKTQVTV